MIQELFESLWSKIPFISEYSLKSFDIGAMSVIAMHYGYKLLKLLFDKLETIWGFISTKITANQNKKDVIKIILDDLHLQMNNLYQLQCTLERSIADEKCFPNEKAYNENLATFNSKVFERHSTSADFASHFKIKTSDYQELNCIYNQIENYSQQTPAQIISKYDIQCGIAAQRFASSPPNRIYKINQLKEECKQEFLDTVEGAKWLFDCIARFSEANYKQIQPWYKPHRDKLIQRYHQWKLRKEVLKWWYKNKKAWYRPQW